MSAAGGRPAGSPGATREDGGATVLTVAMLGVLTMLLGAALMVVGVVKDVHEARAAADLSALAAARPTLAGGVPDCPAARAVAEANGSVLRGCDVLPDGSVQTWVARPRSRAGAWGVGLPEPSARARAGLVATAPP
ncbi:MAG TPA: Rv3654c family TadE-like protein [Ornithinibacter sp.]|nr:Rv3654c family TadE-like protein [Ornithinibacter sp.]